MERERDIYAARGRGTSGDVGQQMQAETHMIGITMEREELGNEQSRR